jgi:hypothetical protein
MVSKWAELSLGDFAPFTYGEGLPERDRDHIGKIPVYGSNGVGMHSKALTKGPAVIIGRKGSVAFEITSREIIPPIAVWVDTILCMSCTALCTS